MSTPHEEYLALGNTDSIRQSVYRSLFRAHVDDELIKDIRVADQPTGKAGEDGPARATIRSEVSFI